MKISIIGCGWLGLPLAEALIRQGHEVKGSTTRKERLPLLEEKQIQPFLIKAEESLTGEQIPSFFQSDLLIVNIPPGRKNPEVETLHPRQVMAIVEAAQKEGVSKLIFISSTSVYGNNNDIVTESSSCFPERPSGKALVEVENWLQTLDMEVSILRLAGLVGGGRHPGNFLAGKRGLHNGNAPVNLVHRDDCIGVILAMIEQEKWNSIYNVCADKHPQKAVFYAWQAIKMGMEPPSFLEGEEPHFKVVSNEKVKEELGYSFIHPDPMHFMYYFQN